MKYIVYDKKTLKVRDNGIYDKEPISITDNLAVARCETIPQGDILTVTNIQPRTEKYLVNETKPVMVKDEITGEEHEVDKIEYVEKEREYFTCDLIGSVDEKKVILNKIAQLKKKLADLDYIGVKIATGRATIEEYAEQIELMRKYANEINNLEQCLKYL